MTRRLTIVWLGACAACLVITGLWFVDASGPCSLSDPELVRLGNKPYCKSDFERFLRRPARFFSLAQAKRYLDQFATVCALRQATERLQAERTETVGDGDVLRHAFPEYSSPIEISDAEAQAYYRSNLARYVHPKQIRIAWMQVSSSQDDAAAVAQSLYTRAQMNLDEPYFHQFLGRVGGDGIRTGETQFLSCGGDSDDVAGVLPAEVVIQLCRLHRGKIIGPLLSGDVWYVARSTALQRARSIPFASVRDEIRGNLASRRKQERYERALEALKNELGIRYATAAIHALVVTSVDGPLSSTIPAPPLPPKVDRVRHEHQDR